MNPIHSNSVVFFCFALDECICVDLSFSYLPTLCLHSVRPSNNGSLGNTSQHLSPKTLLSHSSDHASAATCPACPPPAATATSTAAGCLATHHAAVTGYTLLPAGGYGGPTTAAPGPMAPPAHPGGSQLSDFGGSTWPPHAYV